MQSTRSIKTILITAQHDLCKNHMFKSVQSSVLLEIPKPNSIQGRTSGANYLQTFHVDGSQWHENCLKTYHRPASLHMSMALLYDIDGLVQERRNSSALAMELRFSCTHPLILPIGWCLKNILQYCIFFYNQFTIMKLTCQICIYF